MIILLLSSRCLQSKKELIQLCWRIKINWQCHEFRLNNNPLSNTERKKWCIGQKEIYRIIFIFDFITCTVDVKANLHTWKKKIVNDVRFCTKRSLQNYFDIWLQDMYIVDVKANLHTWKKNWKCGLISWNFNMVKSSCFVFSFVFRTLFFSSVGRGKREGVGILIARKTTKTFYSDWCFYYN